MIHNQKVLICYNKPSIKYQNYTGKSVLPGESNLLLSETSFSDNLGFTLSTLKKKYKHVNKLEFDNNIPAVIEKLKKYKPDVCFNFVESFEGESNYESYVTGIYDILNYEYTGNTMLCLGNCLIKGRTKQILKSYNLPTPNYMVIPFTKTITSIKHILSFPVILKLNSEDASIGISEDSIVYNDAELINRIKYLFKSYKTDVLVEEYIEGREFNVAILGNKVLPISEITFDNLPSNLPKIVTYEAKWAAESLYYKNTVPKCPAAISDKLKNKLSDLALQSFKALLCRDYARVDIRVNSKNKPYVIEVNPNPDISEDTGFARSAKAAGISYPELLNKIIKFATKRKYNGKRN
ncbi:MAG: ATP-grasp domain-containing protein [bacterium]